MIVLCAGCEAPIIDQFLLTVLDRTWHDTCVKCSDCQCQLTDRCFSRDGTLFCKEDFFRRFGSKCFRCNRGIAPTDLVRRARDRVYHVTCFACVVCRRQLMTGDQMIIMEDDSFVCKDDFYRGQEMTKADSDEEGDRGCKRSYNKPPPPPPLPLPPPLPPPLPHLHSSCSDNKNSRPVKEEFPNNSDDNNDDDDYYYYDDDDDDDDDDDTMFRCCANNDDRISADAENESQRNNTGSHSAAILTSSSTSGPGHVTSARPELGSAAFPEVTSSPPPRRNRKHDVSHPMTSQSNYSENRSNTNANTSNNTQSDNERDSRGENGCSKDDPPVTPGGGQGATKRRGPRTTIKAKQLETLKSAFAATPKPTRHIREQLAQETGLNMRVIQVWFQNRRSKERRMKQLNALGSRRHFYRSPRRFRGPRPGEVEYAADAANHLMNGTIQVTASGAAPGITFFSENSDFYSTYSGTFQEFFPLPVPSTAGGAEVVEALPFMAGTLADHSTGDPATDVYSGRHRLLLPSAIPGAIYLQQKQHHQLSPDSVREQWL